MGDGGSRNAHNRDFVNCRDDPKGLDRPRTVCASYAPAADLDGDGIPDLAVPNYGGNTVSVFLGQGNGTFAARVDYSVGSMPTSVVALDLNGDGKPDLATANLNSNKVSVLLNQGDG